MSGPGRFLLKVKNEEKFVNYNPTTKEYFIGYKQGASWFIKQNAENLMKLAGMREGDWELISISSDVVTINTSKENEEFLYLNTNKHYLEHQKN